METEREQKQIKELSDKITLKVFRVGCDDKNYNIIKSLPNTFKQLESNMGITKMPIAKRLNELESVGLLEWKKGKGLIKSTNFTLKFIKLVESINQEVNKNILNFIALK